MFIIITIWLIIRKNISIFKSFTFKYIIDIIIIIYKIFTFFFGNINAIS